MTEYQATVLIAINQYAAMVMEYLREKSRIVRETETAHNLQLVAAHVAEVAEGASDVAKQVATVAEKQDLAVRAVHEVNVELEARALQQ